MYYFILCVDTFLNNFLVGDNMPIFKMAKRCETVNMTCNYFWVIGIPVDWSTKTGRETFGVGFRRIYHETDFTKQTPGVAAGFLATIIYCIWVVATQIFSMFTPIWGRWTHFEEHIFQRRWNHQLDVIQLGAPYFFAEGEKNTWHVWLGFFFTHYTPWNLYIPWK